MKAKRALTTAGKLSVLLLITNIAEILLFLMIAFDAFKSMYSVHEMIALFADILLFVIPIEIIALIISVCRSQKAKEYKTKKGKVIMLVSLFSCVLTAFSVYIFSGGKTTAGYYENIKKISNNSNYYVMIDDRKIKINKAQYEHIIDGAPYYFEYYYNDHIGFSKAESIEDQNGNAF